MRSCCRGAWRACGQASGHRRGHGIALTIEAHDRVKDLPAWPQRQAQLLQIVLGQMRQGQEIDFRIRENGGVFFQSESGKPTYNIRQLPRLPA